MTDTVAQPDVRMRAMTADDLAAAHGLGQAVHWPNRIEDWAFYLTLGRGLVAERGGAVVGTAMCWLYGADAASVGMVIVRPDCQGAGLGKRLMTALLAQIPDRTALLVATQAGLPLYRTLGFTPTGAIRQHQGSPVAVPSEAPAAGERIRPVRHGDATILATLDAGAAGTARDALVAALLDQGAGAVLERDGEPSGFALFRRFGRGYTVGPVIAPTIDGAKALIAHGIASIPDGPVRIDLADGGGLSEWLDDLGLIGLHPVVRMRRGPALAMPAMPRGWAIAGQAFG